MLCITLMMDPPKSAHISATVRHRSIVWAGLSVCVRLLPLLWSRSVHQSLERVLARHLVHRLLHTSFVCVCVCMRAGPSPCLLTLPPRHCVWRRLLSLSLSLFLSLSSQCLIGWSARPWMSYFWRFLLWKRLFTPPTPYLFMSHTHT